jgi:PAS domain S-box-containing protein
MASTKEITGRKRAQEALELAAERFELVTLATQDAVFDWDLVAHEIWRNENCQRLFGAPERSSDSDHWWVDRLHPEDRKHVLAARHAALGNEDRLFLAEYRLRRPDGSYGNFLERSLIVRDARGQVVRMIGALIDITEHQQANEALQEYEKVVEATKSMIAVVDRDYRYLLTNRAFLEHHKLRREQVVGRTVSELLGKEVFERIIKKNLDACFHGKAIQYEMRHTYPNLGERNLLVSYIPIKGPAGIDRVGSAIHDITEQRRAEEALKASEQRYRELFENATDIVFASDLQGNFTSINKAGEQSSGYTRAELTRMNVLQILAPEYAEEGRRVLERLAAGREPETSEWEVVAKDGLRVRLEAGLRLVRRNGELAEVQGIARDITERKRAEEALLESQALLNSIVNSTSELIWSVGAKSLRLLSFNQGFVDFFLQRFGIRAKEGMLPEDLLPTDDLKKRWHALYQRALREGSYTIEYDMKTAPRTLQLSFNVLTRAGAVFAVSVFAKDITERKRAEEALRESEARFRAVFENAAIGIALVDMHGHPVESNSALQKMLGYNKTELPQMAFSEFTHPDDVQQSWNLFTELVEGKRDGYQLEKRFSRKDGRIVWGQMTESLVRNQNGEPQYAIGMVEDISERKRAEEALRELSARLLRLQDKERRRIARELHDSTAQSLAALAMNLSVVKDAASNLSPRARACLSESLELAEQCSREIRTLSYLLHPPLLDEVGLVSALRWFVDGYTQRTGIQVDLEMPPNFTRLPEDIELALYRIVQEGLTNIHLHSGSKRAHVGLKCRPDQAVLTVADEGRGIPRVVTEKGRRHGAKLGVGIPGMRERIRQVGGQLEIITGNSGTTLTAIVPLKEDHA